MILGLKVEGEQMCPGEEGDMETLRLCGRRCKGPARGSSKQDSMTGSDASSGAREAGKGQAGPYHDATRLAL